MARNSKELLQGMIVPDERITLGNIDSTNSSYTEQGPRPGVPVADDSKDELRPIISGAQSVDVRAGIVRAGGVGDAELAFRTSTEGSSDWRGWQSPSAPVWSDSIFYLSGYVAAAHDCTTDPNTQDVYTVHLSNHASNFKVYLTKWSASDWASTTTAIGDTATAYADRALCCSVRVQPSGRIVVFYGTGSQYSDDDGATFATYAQGAWDNVTTSPNQHTRLRVFAVAGQLCAISLVSNDDVQQYASSDEGATWVQLQSGSQTLGTEFDVTEMPDGTAWIVYETTSHGVKAIQLTSAYQLVSSLTAGAETVVSGGVHDEDVEQAHAG